MWLIHEVRLGFAALHRWQTWVVIGLIATFSILAFLVMRLALKTDFVVSFIRGSGGSCQAMSNTAIIAMISGMMFFLLFCAVSLGEFQQYSAFRRRGADVAARKAAMLAATNGFIAASLSIAGLLFLGSMCA